ncbi:hypothetical protein BHE90_014668 [Fusarium euwallaceae]|uniref:Uncharacterized protein n=1 Tax=Fusarium euwallaceae TaxID=1147111 RepID=A0A430L5J1_9HYPO|nr:hypothetical protein BHE90_014668 [Fusarium euwallaceae]
MHAAHSRVISVGLLRGLPHRPFEPLAKRHLQLVTLGMSAKSCPFPYRRSRPRSHPDRPVFYACILLTLCSFPFQK